MISRAVFLISVCFLTCAQAGKIRVTREGVMGKLPPQIQQSTESYPMEKRNVVRFVFVIDMEDEPVADGKTPYPIHQSKLEFACGTTFSGHSMHLIYNKNGSIMIRPAKTPSPNAAPNDEFTFMMVVSPMGGAAETERKSTLDYLDGPGKWSAWPYFQNQNPNEHYMEFMSAIRSLDLPDGQDDEASPKW